MKPFELTIELSKKLEELHKITCQYVREHQGEKGYIDTQDDSNDFIYALHYNDMDSALYEHRVRAVKCDEEKDLLLIVCDDISFRGDYQPEDFELTEEDIRHAEWFGVGTWEDEILYFNTLWSIAENIEEYVE